MGLLIIVNTAVNHASTGYTAGLLHLIPLPRLELIYHIFKLNVVSSLLSLFYVHNISRKIQWLIPEASKA